MEIPTRLAIFDYLAIIGVSLEKSKFPGYEICCDGKHSGLKMALFSPYCALYLPVNFQKSPALLLKFTSFRHTVINDQGRYKGQHPDQQDSIGNTHNVCRHTGKNGAEGIP